ncbi:hypothetical protein RI367_006358 [Sorochytrium milnesiophthora]
MSAPSPTRPTSPAASSPTARSTTITSLDVIRLLAHDLESLEDAIARLNPATTTFDVEAGLAMLHSIAGLRRRLETTPQGPAPAREPRIQPRKPDVFTGKSQDLEHFLAEVDNYLGLLCPQATDDYKIRVVVSFLDKGPLSWYRVSASARPILALDYAVFLEALRTRYDAYDSAAMAEFQMNNMHQSPSQNTLEYIDKFEEATYLAPAGITEEMRATACRRSLLPNVIAGLTQPHTLKTFADLIRAVTELEMQRAEVRNASRALKLQSTSSRFVPSHQMTTPSRTSWNNSRPMQQASGNSWNNNSNSRPMQQASGNSWNNNSRPMQQASGRKWIGNQADKNPRVAPNPSLAGQPTAMDVDFLQGNQHLEDRVLCQKHDILTPGHERPDCPVLHEDELKRANHTHDTELLKKAQA